MITSAANPRVKEVIRLQTQAKARRDTGLYTVEGLRMAQEAPEKDLVSVWASERFVQEHPKAWEDLQGRVMDPQEAQVVGERVFDKLSQTCSPQGILCVLRQRTCQPEDMLTGQNPLLLILDRIQDPGNLGTILRTAEAAGAAGVLLGEGCVELYNPKVIRSTMGAIYRVPVGEVEDLVQVLAFLRERGVRLFAAHLEGEGPYDQEDFTGPCGFLIGNEGRGLRPAVSQAAHTRVRIPMAGQAESLNAAVAASVLAFEAARQRRNQG